MRHFDLPRFRERTRRASCFSATHLRANAHSECAPSLTVIVLVDDRDLGPIEELHDVLISGVEQTLCGIEIDAELLRFRVQIRSGLEMRDVEGVADAVDMLAQNRIRRPEHRLNAIPDLLARCKENATCVSAKAV